jgi:hypothetical protein
VFQEKKKRKKRRNKFVVCRVGGCNNVAVTKSGDCVHHGAQGGETKKKSNDNHNPKAKRKD